MLELQKAQESAKIKIKDAMRTHLLHGIVNDADLTAEDTEAKVIFSLIDRCKTPEEIDDLLHILWNKIKLGFTFDEQPIIKTKEIFVLEKDEKLSFKNTPHTHTHTRQSPHKLILGDNYDALNNLLISYENKIDVIYIDPPYNTGGSDLGYKDRFGKNVWLNFMKARMQLARKLLKNGGSVFVSVDDNMQAYLKILMDEIFGEENFIANIPRKTVAGGKQDEEKIITSHDYVVIYSMQKKMNKNSNFNSSNYRFKDERGCWALSTQLDKKGLSYQKSMDFPIDFDGKIFYPGEKIGLLGKVSWRWSKDLVEFGLKNNLIVNKDGRLYTKTYLEWEIVNTNDKQKFTFSKKEKGTPYKTNMFWDDNGEINLFNEHKYSNETATKMFKSFFSHLDTSNPTFAELIKKMYTKPIELMKDLIKLIPNNNEFVILDFFAGTGSTGHSVLKLNEEDGGKRQFILCTLENDDETNIGIDLCYERLTRIMQGKNANGKDVKDSIDYFTKHTSNKPFGGSLDVYRLKSLDCSLLTKSKIYDEINEENYEMKFKNKQEKINWIDTRFQNLLNHLDKGIK